MVRTPAPILAPALAVSLLLAACAEGRRVADEASPRCQRCHGGNGSAAPPRSPRGDTATSALAVGAHRAHVEGGALAGPIGCAGCHPVLLEGDRHPVGSSPRIAFGPVARSGPPPGAAPGWDRATATCAGVYCHGATLQGGSNPAPTWTSVGAGQAACGACHGLPPTSHGAFGPISACDGCHGETVLASGAIDVAAGKHVNGVVELSLPGGGGTGCARCHAAPPDTGAHRAHAAGVPAGELTFGDLRVFEDWTAPGSGYAFGCGHCHPTDPALHFADAGGDGLPDVVLGPPAPAVAGDDLKGRNDAGASWDPASGRCSGVACHSDGRDPPTFATTPPWTTASVPLACDGCHAHPPRYASGGAGAADANSHVQLQAGGWEWGHTLGLPGNWAHSGRHGLTPGTADAAPITCQTCHFESVAGAGPSGFYWLETNGRWQLEGGDPGRLQSPRYLNLDCTRCHRDGGAAPAGSGRAHPLRHVNGRRDVVFDARTALPPLPELPWLPAAPNRPSRPYWATGVITVPPGVDAVEDGSTLSMHLAGASYAPATKTCSNVTCHLAQAAVQWGTPYGAPACSACHGF